MDSIHSKDDAAFKCIELVYSQSCIIRSCESCLALRNLRFAIKPEARSAITIHYTHSPEKYDCSSWGRIDSSKKRVEQDHRKRVSDVELDNKRLLNIAQAAMLDACIATRTAENLVRKIVASAIDRVITTAQH